MNNQQLVEYIRQQLSSNVSKEEISKALIANGWQATDINEAFSFVENPSFVPQSIPIVVSTQSINGKIISIGQLFSASWDVYKQHALVLVTLLVTPYAFFMIGKLLSANGSILTGFFVNCIGILLFIPIFPATVFAVSRNAGFSESFAQGVRMFLPSLWCGILLGLTVMGGTVMFIIPAFLMAVWFSLSIFTFTIEGKRGLNALLQSREYIRGYWWAVLGRIFLVGLVVSIPISILSAVMSGVFGKAAGTVAYFVLATFTGSFTTVYSYKLYQSLATIKPTLAGTTPTSGRWFYVASAILGILILIVGIIVPFTLSGSNGARTIGQVATAKSSMGMLQIQSAVYYDASANKSYLGFCNSSGALALLSSASKGNVSATVCNDSLTAWAASAPLPTKEFLCVDSTDRKGTTVTSPLGNGQTSCSL